MSLLHKLTGCFTEKKKQFRDNGNSLAGEVKHKSMGFVKYLLRISCFLVLKFGKFFEKFFKGFYFCSNTAGYKIIRAMVCVLTRLITILLRFSRISLHKKFAINMIRSLHVFAFSIASVKLKQIQFCLLFCFFSHLSFLSFLSSPLDY